MVSFIGNPMAPPGVVSSSSVAGSEKPKKRIGGGKITKISKTTKNTKIGPAEVLAGALEPPSPAAVTAALNNLKDL